MIISHIVAIGAKNEIGCDGKMLWHIPKDFKNFKKITSNHHILMGRKTFESIGRPLPNRENLIISRNKDYFSEGVTIFNTLDLAIDYAEKNGESELFILGGSEIYKQTQFKINKIYISRVHCSYHQADRFYTCDTSEFKLTFHQHYPKEKAIPSWDFEILEKL